MGPGRRCGDDRVPGKSCQHTQGQPNLQANCQVMAGCCRRGCGHAGFEGGAGIGWMGCAVLVCRSTFWDTICRIRRLALLRGKWKPFSKSSAGNVGQCVHAEDELCTASSWGESLCLGYQLCAGVFWLQTPCMTLCKSI